jgi:hypothetical protein
MAATISPPCPNGITTSPKLLRRESKVIPQLQSLERQKLAEITETIWQHLTPVEQLLESHTNNDEISYRPVPPKRSFTVRVRYQSQGRGEPLTYSLDLDDE